MPNFTDNKIDRAYESFMKQVPGFQRDLVKNKPAGSQGECPEPKGRGLCPYGTALSVY
jgi:hypothetical protein